MKIRIPFIAGAAIGYVLGTKAGRERYEQIRQQSRKLAENPRVQETAGVLRTKSGELAGTAKQKADDAKQRMGNRRHGEHERHGEPPAGTPSRSDGRFSETSPGSRTGTGAPAGTGTTTPAGTGSTTPAGSGATGTRGARGTR